MKQSSEKCRGVRLRRSARPHVVAIRRSQSRFKVQASLPPVAIDLPDGKKLVTTATIGISDRPSRGRAGRPDRTVIRLIGKTGRRTLWKPGMPYTHGAMWHADARGNLYGYDLRRPGRVSICRLNGEHVATLHLSLLRKTILKPALFGTSSRGIRYIAANGQRNFLTWKAIERKFQRRRGRGYAGMAMRWLTGRPDKTGTTFRSSRLPRPYAFGQRPVEYSSRTRGGFVRL